MIDIYEALVHLQYPKITLVNLKNVESQILTGEGRICLLSWLLQQSPKIIFPLLNKLKGPALEEELFKYYCQIGICNDKDKLFGKCSLKNQLSTLKLLLLYMKNMVADSRKEDETDELPININLQEYFEKTVNVLPANCNINTKLTQVEVNKYIEETRKNVTEIKPIISDSNDTSLESETEFTIQEKLRYIQEVNNEKYSKNFEKFAESFKILETGSPKLPLQNSYNMNEAVHQMNSYFSTIKQTLDCKDEILHISIPIGLQTSDVPLTETIDDNVFWLQRVSNVQTEDDDLQ